MIRKPFFALMSLLLPAALSAQQPGLETAAATITQDDYAWRVGVIAHDSMEGRDTPSAGLDRTAEWIASEFRRLGLRGGAEGGGFIQRYPLQRVVVDAGGSNVRAGGTRLSFGSDVIPFGSASGGETTADLVVLSGVEGTPAARAVQGKHVAVILGTGGRRFSMGVVSGLRSAGAASIMLVSVATDAAWDNSAQRAMRSSVRKGWSDEEEPGAPASTASTPTLQVRAEAFARLIEGRGVDLEALQGRSEGSVRVDGVPGVSLTITLQVTEEQVTAPNVVGILDGSDATLKSEYVIFSGHMDHVGMGTPDANGDSIFNGADDDASGTVAVIEVAEAMAALPVAPKRSTIFLLVSGEEKGLWGSEYFANNPSVPIEQLVADVNTDMVGRNWPDTIVAIGKEHSDLGATLNRVNGDHPELRMTAIDDVWPEERFYFRSDHYNFARKGVPVLFFFNGTHDDYHGRDDEPDRIDAEKAARIARLVFYLGVDIANAAERPKWNPESYSKIVSDRE